MVNKLQRLLVFVPVVIWGVTWPLSKAALAYSPPILLAGMRSLMAGLLLLLIAIPKKEKLQFRKYWGIYLVSGIFNSVLFYGLQILGLQYMASGLFTVIVYLQPIFIGLIAWLWIKEPMTRAKVVGLLLGFMGVAVVSVGGVSGHISVMGVILGILTALSWAIGTVYIKKEGYMVDGVWLITCQSLIGGTIMTTFGSYFEKSTDIVWGPPYILSMIFLSVFSVAIAWIVYAYLLKKGEASRVASFNFLVPVIAIVIGTLLLDEPFNYSVFVGLAFVIVSIILVNYQGPYQKKKNLIASDMNESDDHPV